MLGSWDFCKGTNQTQPAVCVSGLSVSQDAGKELMGAKPGKYKEPGNRDVLRNTIGNLLSDNAYM